LQASEHSPTGNPLRALKIMTVINLVLLSVQGWTGDTVNLFASFPQGAVNGIGGALQSLGSTGGISPITLFHAMEGVAILLISIGIAVAAFRRSRLRSVRVTSLLGLLFVISAVVGGYLFVFSGFLNNANSAQMGGSFIGTYAMNFLVLYYSKQG